MKFVNNVLLNVRFWVPKRQKKDGGNRDIHNPMQNYYFFLIWPNKCNLFRNFLV